MDPNHQYSWQAWGVMEFREGAHDEARELFQRGVWADPKSDDAPFIFHVICWVF